jgi:transcription antitermination factor NusG
MNTGRWNPSSLSRGDDVKVMCGPFAGLQGVVRDVDEWRDLVRVELKLDRRATWVEMEPWQLERATER